MNSQLIILTFAWALYGLLHSLFATDSFKLIIKQLLGTGFKYYRLYYSLFATLSLVALLWYHVQIYSPVIWHATIIQKIVAVVMAAVGLAVMVVCARVYFMEITGLDVFTKKRVIHQLVETGLHKYVRHPLYTGTLLFMWAFFVYSPSLKNLAGCAVTTLYILIGILLEEKKLIAAFGNKYKNYAAKTPRLIPRIK